MQGEVQARSLLQQNYDTFYAEFLNSTGRMLQSILEIQSAPRWYPRRSPLSLAVRACSSLVPLYANGGPPNCQGGRGGVYVAPHPHLRFHAHRVCKYETDGHPSPH